MEVLVQAVVYEFSAALSKTVSAKGRRCSMPIGEFFTPTASLLQTLAHLVQPSFLSVVVSVQKSSPAMVAPQWATVSPSQLPGRSTSW